MANSPSQPTGAARRADLLPNEKEVSYENLIEWIDHRKNWLLGLFGAAILAIVGLVAWRYQEAKIETDAAVALSEARSIESLQFVAQKHAGTRSGVFASMALADILFQQGEYEKAAACYQGVLNNSASSPMAPAAVLGLGAIEEARGNKEQALSLYRSIPTASPNAYTAPQAVLAAAKLLERMDRPLEARQAYEDLAARYAASPARAEALDRLNRINAALRKSTVPAAPVIPPAPAPLKK